jgi:uncharacterized protein
MSVMPSIENRTRPLRWGALATGVLAVCLIACGANRPKPESQPSVAPAQSDTIAASPAPPKPSPGFAWSVLGTSTTITLVGSIHVGFEGLYPLPEPVERAFSESTTLAMELALDQEPPEQVAAPMIKGAALPSGQTLHDCLSEKAWLRYQEFVAEHHDQGVFFNRFRPWFVAVFLSGEQSALDGYDPDKGLDMYFFKKRGTRRVIGVEKAEDHVRALSGLPGETQELMLLEQLDAMNVNEDELATVVKLWKAGDADGLAREMFSEFDNPQYLTVYDALIAKRNERMTKQVEGWLAGKERMFVVLGAGHFVGKDGIVARLQHDGWVPQRL